MNKIFFFLLSFPILFTSCHAQQNDQHFEQVAIVELFTSEGCSSCPPADKLLTKLTSAAERDHKKIFTLSFHVDYWDRLGWKDPFSNSLYSDRQRQYAEVMNLNGSYTPQMVVNGKYEFVGSDESKMNDAISKTLRINATTSISKLSVTTKENGQIAVTYELKGDYKASQIHFALVSKQESTAVKRGENGGRQLNHTNVVRQFLSAPASAQGTISLEKPADVSKDNLVVIAYVQHSDDLHIVAGAEARP